jgi:iron complex transport system substrate-binding protein
VGCTWKEDRLGAPSKVRWVTLLVTLALIAGGCSEPPSTSQSGESFPVTIEAGNNPVRVPRRPERIVSLSPTATEILFAIGAGPQVVAVDEASSYPVEAPRTELSGYTPNIEALASYRPDLVVYSSDPGGLRDALNTLGTPALLQPAAERLEDAYRQIAQLGTATGRRAESSRLVESMKERIAAITESAAEPESSYYHELDEGYYTATSKTFIGEVYGLLGLKNIADAAGTGYVQLSGEFIVQANPDLIFLADARCCGQSAATVAARPGWDQIDAVKKGAVFPLDDDIASRWGPRTVDFLQAIAESLEPGRP